MQNIDLAFTYQFKDKEGIKKIILGSLLLASCIFLIPIPVVIGYYLALQRNVMEKKADPLPEFTNFGELFIDGLKFMLAGLGYSLPWLVFSLFTILVIIITMSIDEDLAGVALLIILPFQGLMMLYGLLILLITPVLYIKGAQRRPWKEYYYFSEIYYFVKNNIANILIVTVLNWACSFIVNFGMLFFFVGIFPAAFYCGTIVTYLYGQLYLQSQK